LFSTYTNILIIRKITQTAQSPVVGVRSCSLLTYPSQRRFPHNRPAKSKDPFIDKSLSYHPKLVGPRGLTITPYKLAINITMVRPTYWTGSFNSGPI